METAAGRRVEEIRRLAGEGHKLAFFAGDAGKSREQGLGVGVDRVLEDLGALTDLDYLCRRTSRRRHR